MAMNNFLWIQCLKPMWKFIKHTNELEYLPQIDNVYGLVLFKFLHWGQFLPDQCPIGNSIVIMPASWVPQQRSEVAVFLKWHHSQIKDLATNADYGWSFDNFSDGMVLLNIDDKEPRTGMNKVQVSVNQIWAKALRACTQMKINFKKLEVGDNVIGGLQMELIQVLNFFFGTISTFGCASNLLHLA